MGKLYAYDGSTWVEISKNGTDGTNGTAATISVGTTTTGAAGSSAAVTNSGTSSAAVFDFTIPSGTSGTNGTDGAPGSKWYEGSGAPSTTHNDGDFYLNTSNGDVYEQVSGAWGSPVGNIQGPAGSGSGDVNGPASSTSGDIATFSGTTGKLIQDSGKTLPTGTIVGTTDTQVLTNKDLTSVTNTYPTFNQNTTGSAATLTTGRTFRTNLASTSTATFNGSANVTPGVTGTLPVANGGTGATTLTGILKGSGTAAVTAVTAPTGTIVGTSDTQALTNKDLSSTTNTFPTFLHVAIGNFTSPSTTGNYSVTGVGFKPKIVRFIEIFGTGTSTDQTCIGAMTASAQYVTSWHGTAQYSSTTACLANITTGAAANVLASYVSMDTDGFTINFSAASAVPFAWEAWG